VAQLTTLQIATFGSDMQEGIAAGIRNFPIHKLALICYSSDNQKAEEFSRRIRGVIGIPVTITIVNKDNVIRDVLESVGEIIGIEGKNFQQILMNVSCGDKLIGCAAPLLSYHIMGGKEARGLAELGLVEVEKGDRGKLSTKLTTLGKLLVVSNNNISSTVSRA
jgi:hypothetical protein